MQGLCPLNGPYDFSKNSIYLAYLKVFGLNPIIKKVENSIFI